MNYFLSVVQYDRMQENGAVKRVSEPYLFDAVSYTEAEARTIQELTPYISGEFTIRDIKRPRIAELVTAEDAPAAEKFYKAKLAFITLDEKTGVEKQSVSALLIMATDFNDAYERLLRHMNGTMADWELLSLEVTRIVEYYPAK